MIELYHHGILGQKWGKQNGPPYPLSRTGDWSAAERRMQKKNYKKTVRTFRRTHNNPRINDAVRSQVRDRIDRKYIDNVDKLNSVANEVLATNPRNKYELESRINNYLTDSGISKQEYLDISNAYKNYDDQLKSAINDVLGEYANKPLHRYYSNESSGDYLYKQLKVKGDWESPAPLKSVSKAEQKQNFKQLEYADKYVFSRKKSWNDIKEKLDFLKKREDTLLNKDLHDLYVESNHGSTDKDFSDFTKKYGVTPTQVRDKYEKHLYEIADQLLGEDSNKKIGNKKARDVYVSFSIVDWT